MGKMKSVRLSNEQHIKLLELQVKLLSKGTNKLPSLLREYIDRFELRTWILPDVIELGLEALLTLLGDPDA